ncbi:MAG: hypothetical protein V3U98_01300 [Acidobacteriota bacterium]
MLPLRDPILLFLGLALAMVLVALTASCVANTKLIQNTWNEALRRSGYPREEIRRPEIIAPAKGSPRHALPRDENNQPVVAQYFPLSHQVRIYARMALPMRRILLRQFLYAIYFDRLATRPLDVESLAEMDSAEIWVKRTLANTPRAAN